MYNLMVCLTAIMAGVGLDRLLYRLLEAQAPAIWRERAQDAGLMVSVGVAWLVLGMLWPRDRNQQEMPE